MLLNYLNVALRALLANPLHSIINVLGLTIGLACCIIISVFVQHELSYDKHWENAERIQRVTIDFYGNDLELARVAPPIGPLLLQDFPEIEAFTRIMQPGSVTITRNGVATNEQNVAIADSNVFDFFNLDFVSGDRDSALDLANGIVLSERAATRYFGNEDPMGQTITIMGQSDVTVTGVFKDLPDNTHMVLEIVLSIDVIPIIMGPEALQNWGSNNYFTYLLLPEDYEPETLTSRFGGFLNKHRGEGTAQGIGLGLQPLADIHLTSNRDAEWRENGSLAVVYTFSAVALVVLIIACVNFMNLTTARSTQRAREVGMRKVAGASRSQLVMQFIGESILLTSVAMLLAVALVEVLLPVFNGFLESSLTFSITEPTTLVTLLFVTLLVGTAAGSYPAFYLSHFEPAQVLKGASSEGKGGHLRRVLVVFQFTTSIAMLIATGVVMAQMQFVRDIDMGFDRARNITAHLPYFSDLWETYEPLRIELEAHPDIESVVYSSRVPSMQNLDGSGYIPAGQQIVMENIEALSDIKVDAHWFEHYGIEFLAGRAFHPSELRPETPSEENPTTTGYAILNASAAQRFGWTPEEAIGQVIVQPLSQSLDRLVEREVIGVIPDLYFSSLHDVRKATVFAEPHPRYDRHVSIKLAPGDHSAAIAHLESVWSRLVPNESLNWGFLDDSFDARYRSENRQMKLFGVFALIAIFVATLGLFGLASFTTERRTKEIAVRKVMGASVSSIIMLLTKDFTKLVLIANIFAWPLAYYFMSDWLTRFAYALPFGEWAWLFFAAASIAFGVAWFTIALQASRVALSRPAMSLRYE